MKITKRRLARIIKEEIATLKKDVIDDEVMGVLSDEGGAAGIEPIEDALKDLEDDEISLPDEDIEDIISGVPGVKRHKDGDFIDTTQLEGRGLTISQRQIARIIKEERDKLLVEMNPMVNADRAVGGFANASTVDQVTQGILNLLQEIEMGAVEEEGLEDEEAEEFARNGAILAVAQAFQSAGLIDVYMALTKLLR